MSESSEEDDAWMAEARKRTSARAMAAVTTSDRLASLRELIRLHHGRLTLANGIAALASADSRSFPRFGLEHTPDGEAIRLGHPPHLAAIDAALPAALRLDERSRTVNEPANPDAYLLRHSPHRRYRAAIQKSAVRALATMPPGSTLLVSMPTGAGKSLLFQVMARQAIEGDRRSAVVVIVPTIALALDHERALRSHPGLEGSRAMVDAMSHEERQQVRGAFRRGEIPILLTSPETALGYMHEAILEAATPRDAKSVLHPCRLAGFVVDEAHIVEQWGRSFRPAFQRLSGLVAELRARDPGLRALLLSATLPSSVRSLLRREYRREGAWLEVHASVPRYEFDLFAKAFGSAAIRDEALMSLIDVLPRPAIVYTTLVAAAEELHARLRLAGYQRSELFTGRLDGPARTRIVEAWSRDEIDLIVATSAFGMGIDKADVRAVVHACLPDSAARYYQEIGRAARDGHQAYAVALWTRHPAPANDASGAMGMATKSWLTIDLAIRRWDAIVREATAADLTFDPTSGHRVLRVNLEAFHDTLDTGRTDENVGWNQALLTLMQRAGLVRVLGGPRQDGDPLVPSWAVEILDEDVLGLRDPESPPWRRFARTRDGEQREARADFERLERSLRGGGRTCLLVGVHAAIDPDAVGAPACGRCPACRAERVDPPRGFSAGDLDARWPALPEGEPPGEPAGLHVLTSASDPRVDAWLSALARAGVEQFLVPSEDADAVADALALTRAPKGFVTEWRSGGDDPPFGLADMSTAFVPSPDAEPSGWLPFVRRAVAQMPGRPHFLVVRAGLTVGGRPLGQVASIHPPRSVDALRSAIPVTGDDV